MSTTLTTSERLPLYEPSWARTQTLRSPRHTSLNSQLPSKPTNRSGAGSYSMSFPGSLAPYTQPLIGYGRLLSPKRQYPVMTQMPLDTFNAGIVIHPGIFWNHPAGNVNDIHIHFRTQIAQLPGPIEHIVLAGSRAQSHWIWPWFHHYSHGGFAQVPHVPVTHYSQIPNTHMIDRWNNTHNISVRFLDHSHPRDYPAKYIPSTLPPVNTPYGLMDPAWELRQIDRLFAYKPHPVKMLIVINPTWCSAAGNGATQALSYAIIGATTRGIPVHMLS